MVGCRAAQRLNLEHSLTIGHEGDPFGTLILMRTRKIADDNWFTCWVASPRTCEKGGKAWAVTYHGGCRCQSFPMEKTSFKRDDRVERELFGFCRMNWMEWASLWDELKPHDVSAHLIRRMQCVVFPATRSSSKRHKGQAMGLKLMA